MWRIFHFLPYLCRINLKPKLAPLHRGVKGAGPPLQKSRIPLVPNIVKMSRAEVHHNGLRLKGQDLIFMQLIESALK